MSKPVVAIVGRPNVGKSTLFNALAGEMISIVKDTPGVTRDRIYADVTWLDKEFTMIDTGGIEPDSKDIILSQMREQAQIAIDTADVIIFITDVKQGLVDADSKVADMLRRSGKPVVLVVNKVDNFDKYMNSFSAFKVHIKRKVMSESHSCPCVHYKQRKTIAPPIHKTYNKICSHTF